MGDNNKRLSKSIAHFAISLAVGAVIGFVFGPFVPIQRPPHLLPAQWTSRLALWMAFLGGIFGVLGKRHLQKRSVQAALLGWMAGALIGMLTAHLYAEHAVEPPPNVPRFAARNNLVGRVMYVTVPICGATGAFIGWLTSVRIKRQRST